MAALKWSATEALAIVFASATLMGASSLASAQVPGSQLPDGTVVPDFSGIWERIEGIRFNPAGTPPPYNAEYQRRYDLAIEARNRGERVADPTSKCLPQGMPRFMVASYPLEVLQTKGQVTLIAEWSSQVRRIFTDGRGHPPADHPHSKMGHSIGHWEGGTLVVDTTHLSASTILNNGLNHGENLHVIERFRLSDDGTQLLGTQEFEDPDTLNNRGYRLLAWTFSPETEEYIYPYECDPSFGANYGVFDAGE